MVVDWSDCWLAFCNINVCVYLETNKKIFNSASFSVKIWFFSYFRTMVKCINFGNIYMIIVLFFFNSSSIRLSNFISVEKFFQSTFHLQTHRSGVNKFLFFVTSLCAYAKQGKTYSKILPQSTVQTIFTVLIWYCAPRRLNNRSFLHMEIDCFVVVHHNRFENCVRKMLKKCSCAIQMDFVKSRFIRYDVKFTHFYGSYLYFWMSLLFPLGIVYLQCEFSMKMQRHLR